MDQRMAQWLELGLSAPSGDNCQPWRFQVQGEKIRLFNRPDKDTSLYNHGQRASLVAHGALLETLELAAPSFGLKVEVKELPDPQTPDLMAELVVSDGPTVETDIPSIAQRRCTNRKPFAQKSLSAPQIEALKRAAEGIEGATIRLVTSPESVAELAQTLKWNDRLVFENPNLHDFLFTHIRWNAREAEETRDGLDMRTLELKPMDAIGFRLLKSWPLVNALNKVGLSRKVAGQAHSLCQASGAYVAVAIPGMQNKDLLRGGRALQRVWLEVTRQGLQAHPTAGLAFLIQKVAAGAVSDLSGDHVRVIREVESQLRKMFDWPNGQFAMILRVGNGQPPSVRSLRMSVNEVVA